MEAVGLSATSANTLHAQLQSLQLAFQRTVDHARADPDDHAAEQTRVDFDVDRDAAAVAKALEAVRRVARTEESLLPTLIEAARVRATVGEVMNALADVFGRYDGAAKW